MAANLIDETTDEVLVNGFFQVEHTRLYQVIAADTSVGSATVLAASGIPAIGSVIVYGATPVYCYRRTPKRVDTDNQRLKWIVTCQFSNDTSRFLRNYLGQPVSDPADAAPTVDISFFESSEPFNKGVFLGCYDAAGNAVGVDTSPMVIGASGPVLNSALDSFGRDRRAFDKAITYWKYYSSYDNSWESLIGKTNSGTVTMTQSDQNGTRLSQSFNARELLLTAIIKQDVWMQGQLYFRIGFQMLKARDTWTVDLLDEGTRQLIFEGQYKWGGGTYSAADIDAVTDRDYYKQEIPSYDDAGTQVGLVGQPVPLNGIGMPIPVKQYGTNANTDGKNYFFRFLEFDEASYTPLGIV